MSERSPTAHGGRVLWREASRRVVDCAGCGYAHLDPLPGEEELRTFYATEFYGSWAPHYLEDADPREQAWMATTFDDRLHLLARFTDGRRLLDVGAGRGAFLEHARRRGWEPAALEPSTDAAAVLGRKGLPCHLGLVEDLEPEASYDAVAAAMLLEHVRDPGAALERMRGWLVEEGVLLVVVPNDFNLLQREIVAGGTPAWFVAPGLHLNYFDFPSLERLLERSGFAPVARSTSFPMSLFVLCGDDFVASPERGADCHRRRRRFDASLSAAGRRDLYERLARVELGRHAVVVARRR